MGKPYICVDRIFIKNGGTFVYFIIFFTYTNNKIKLKKINKTEAIAYDINDGGLKTPFSWKQSCLQCIYDRDSS